MSTYLVTYKVGDIVDIKANSAEQKGMPHKVRLLTSLLYLFSLLSSAYGAGAAY